MSFSSTPARASAALLSLLLSASSLGAATNIINIGDNFFGPPPGVSLYSFSIATGDTVTWTNTGFVTHNVISFGSPSFTSSPPSIPPDGTYSFTFTTAGAYTYLCSLHANQNGVIVVTNLSTNVPPTIVTQPASQTVLPGTTVGFTVVAAGTAPLAYQWRTNGVNLTNGGRISGATSATLTVSSVVFTDAGAYDVVVTNLAGSATSSSAVLTVITAPTITSQPSGASVTTGASATFSVVALGTAPLTYQWRRNGTNLLNATNASFTVSNAQATNAGNYSVVVSNVAGTVTSVDAPLVVNTLPTITSQPSGATVNSGASVTFSVVAAGTAPLTYQWRRNGTNLVNATNTSFTVSNAQAANAGNYSVVVGNVAGTVTSVDAPLVVNTPPTITSQPSGAIVNPGASVTFSVVASGTAPLTYQWRRDGTNLVNATNTSFTVSNVQATNTGNYSVVVSNVAGSVTSVDAPLVINGPPVILEQPQGATVNLGTVLNLFVTATSPTPITYQWRLNGANLAGQTANGITVAVNSPALAGNFTVVLANSAGSVTSAVAAIVIATPPVITSQPQSTTVAAGAGAMFSVASSGTSPFTYQWQLNGTNLLNATNANFTLAAATTNDAGPYRVAVSNMAGGLFSSNAILTVVTPPVMVVQPSDQTVFAGSNATFTATASGLFLFHQWRRDGLNMAGATNTTLSLTNAVRTNSGIYTLLVTNLAGMATSSPASLTVHVRQRLDAPGAVGGGVFRLRFGFEDGVSLGAGDLARFDAQTTTNFVDWVTLTNALSLINGQLQLDDSGAPQFVRRFYRIIER